METFDALAGPSRQVSKKRPDAGAERVVSDHEADESVDFVLPCASSRRLMGLYANACTFNSSSMAVSRFEIVNAAA